MTSDSKPRLGALPKTECETLLRRNSIGRLAFTFHDHVDIEPIGYAFSGSWIVGRTSPGTKLTTLLHHPWVAFEVDEVHGPFDWKSVVVHGAVELLDAVGAPKERASYDEAVRVLQAVDPRALGPEDPVPERTVVFRIHADELTGRQATTAKLSP